MNRPPAGIGKSALLGQVRAATTGFRIVEASGSELETELPFAGLHQLCRPLLELLDELPHTRAAHGSFADMGLESFAARAAGELRASGERARARAADTADTLTLQEVHIARLVADGATSKEVAAQLCISPRTVDAHLRNIFRKLAATSRKQLRDVPGLRVRTS